MVRVNSTLLLDCGCGVECNVCFVVCISLVIMFGVYFSTGKLLDQANQCLFSLNIYMRCFCVDPPLVYVRRINVNVSK